MSERVLCPKCGKPVSTEQAAKDGGLCLLCSIRFQEKIPCIECGKPVSVKQASKRGGLCLRCSANRNPFFVLYSSLVDRVCNSPGGFDSLSEPEKLYYALTLLQNEVNNGGFHQFFFNTSGSYYELIENGLVAFNEPDLLELLHQAKRLIFPDNRVPTDMKERREQMEFSDAGGDLMNKLDALDQQFYRRPDTLNPKLETFARERGLVPPVPEHKGLQS